MKILWNENFLINLFFLEFLHFFQLNLVCFFILVVLHWSNFFTIKSSNCLLLIAAPRLKKCSIKKLFLKISQNSQQVCVFVWIYEFFRTPFLYNFSGGCLCVCILRTIQAILVSLLIKLNFLERVSRRTSNKFVFSRNKPFPSFISCTVLCCMSYL